MPKNTFILGSKGELKKKKKKNVDLRDLDLGSSSKISKNPSPSKLKVEDVVAKPEAKSKGAPKGSGLDVVATFFRNTPGSPIEFGVGYDGVVLNAANYIRNFRKLPIDARFVSSRPGCAIRAARGGYRDALVDEAGNLNPNGNPIIIGDRRTNGSMKLQIRLREHSEARDKFKEGLLKERKRAAKNKRLEDVRRVAEASNIDPDSIIPLEESTITEFFDRV